MIIIFRSGSGGDGSFIVNEREKWIIFKKLYETWNKPLNKRTLLKKIFVTAHFTCKTYKK